MPEIDYYEEYYTKLVEEFERRRSDFPDNFNIGSHGDRNYYLHSGYRTYSFSLVYSSMQSRAYGRDFQGFIVEVFLRGKNYENKYNMLLSHKAEVEKKISDELFWQPKDETQSQNACRIYVQKSGVITDKNRWDENIDWQLENLAKFIQVFSKYKLSKINQINGGKIMPDQPYMNKTKEYQKNIILYGPPGVGKTYNHKKIVSLIENRYHSQKELFKSIIQNQAEENIDSTFDAIKNEGRVEFITFHQSFSYEDFIEGYRPNGSGNIHLEDGVFKKIAKKATQNQDKIYYLIIDEINRGNISKIFGELITLIEEDKRDSIEVTLPYSKEPFKVPGNLYIIATMNSTDKSIALIDIALRRRFTFLKMQPNVELVKDEAKDLFTELNNFISEKLGSDFQIGHSYFMDYDDLDFVLDYKIVPLLEEYFFADSDSLQEIKKIIGKGE